MSDIVQPGVPIRFDWRNFRRQYRERGIGPLYLLQVEISAETWAQLETMPREADGELVMWVTEIGGVKEEKPKKERKSKGPYGLMWSYLHPNGGKGGAGFVTIPRVALLIETFRETATEPVWEILHRVFGVGGGTLAGVGPEEVLTKFERDTQVVLAVERAMKFQNEKESRDGSNS